LALELLERWGGVALVHAEWKNCPPSLLAVLARRPPDKLPVPLLTWRWALWFKPWGSDKANKMMTDLAFEKDLKRDILSLL
jgi:hypothetical protein